MNNKKTIVLVIVALLLLLTGCVGKREINDLALVMLVGIDKGDDELIKITVQVARPADARGQTGAPAGNTGDPVWSANAQGKTIFEAIRNLSTFSTRRVFWAHNFAIVINEKVAKEGIGDIIDFFTRNPELRMNTWVAVTPDEAEDIVSTLTGLEVTPGEAIDKLFRYTRISSQAPRTQMLDVFSAYLSEGTEPILARVKLIDRGVSNKKPGQAGSVKQVELAGAGIFKHDKLVGTLNAKEVKGILPFFEEIDSSIAVLNCPDNKDKKVTVEIRNPKVNIIPNYKNELPEFKVKMQVNSTIIEAGCTISLENEVEIRALEKQLEKQLITDTKKVLKKLQSEFNSDVLQLGKVFNNKYPSEWKQIKGEWNEKFAEAKIDIEVDARVRATALYYQSRE